MVQYCLTNMSSPRSFLLQILHVRVNIGWHFFGDGLPDCHEDFPNLPNLGSNSFFFVCILRFVESGREVEFYAIRSKKILQKVP